MKHKLLFFLVALLSTMTAWADVIVDGLIYRVTSEDSITVKLIGYDGAMPMGSLVIPATVNNDGNDYAVTSIGDGAFYGCSGLTSVTIGNSVTSIGESAFYNCSGLKEVHITDIAAWCNINFDSYSNPLTYANHLFMDGMEITDLVIPNGVTSIGNSAFSWCSGLTSITIPNSVTSIGNSAFYWCSGLTSVTIGNSVTSIGEEAFAGCTNLTTVIIPNSVASIGEGAFQGCSGLTSITISDGVTSIGNFAFQNCSGLTSITIPNNVTSIDFATFEGCTGLISVTIPNSVTSIGDEAFYGCTGLISITIPNSVTSIEGNAFDGCTGLTFITVEESSPVYDSRNNCNAIIEKESSVLFLGCKNTIIPNSVTSIGNGAFSYCSGLTSITIPDGVTSIGNGAFWNCSGLTSVTIPNSVTSIGAEAFSWCSSLNDIYCYADPTQLTWEYDIDEFKPDKETKCHVRADKLAAYKEKFFDANVTFVGDLEGDFTAIESLTADTTNGAWYTLTGMQLEDQPTAPGIYVKDGKKVYVK